MPSAFIAQISESYPTTMLKAILFPSGDHAPKWLLPPLEHPDRSKATIKTPVATIIK